LANVKPGPGERVRQVTETEVLPADSRASRKWPPQSEFWDFIEKLSPEQWKEFDCTVTIYRGWKGDRGKMCEQIYAEDLASHPFNRKWVQKTYGGGKYRFMTKLEGQLSFDYDDEFDGEPIAANNAGGANAYSSYGVQPSSDLAIVAKIFTDSQRELIAELRAARGGDIASQATRDAMGIGIDVLKTAVPAVASVVAGAAVPHSQPTRDPLMEQLMQAAIAKLLNPSDPIETFGKMFTAMKSFMDGNGGSGGGSETWAQTLVRAIPQALQSLAPNLQSMTAMRQQEIEIARMRAGAVNVPAAVLPAPAPGSAPPSVTPAAPTPPPAAPPGGASAIDIVQAGIVEILRRDTTVDDAADNALFLLDLYAMDLMTQLAQNLNAEEELLTLFRTQPILANNVPQNPRLTEFIKKLIEKLRISRQIEMAPQADPPPAGPYAPEQPSA